MPLNDSRYGPVIAGLLVSVIGASAVFETAQATSALVGRASVIDSDTIEIQGKRIRLWGIDAAENSQWCFDASENEYRCGRDAAFRLDDLLLGKIVQCAEKDRDRYQRIVAECFFKHPTEGEVNVNATMVIRGDAVAYRKYSKATSHTRIKPGRSKEVCGRGGFRCLGTGARQIAEERFLAHPAGSFRYEAIIDNRATDLLV